MALIASLAWYLTTVDWAEIAALRLEPLWLVVGTVIAVVPLFGYVLVWVIILRSIGADVRFDSEVLSVYARAWLGRYIPGKAPWILGKIYFASRRGIPTGKLAVSSLLEAALQVVAAVAVSVAVLLVDRRLAEVGWQITAMLWIALAVSVLAVAPPVFNALLRVGARVLRRELASADRIGWRSLGTSSAVYVVLSVVSGSGLFFIARSINPDLGWNELPYVAASGILAGAIGMLAIFAPSGLGVRDGILLAMLTVVMSPEEALAVTIVSRLWSVVVDAIFVAVAAVIAGFGSRRAKAAIRDGDVVRADEPPPPPPLRG